ncbi:MAG: DUF2857 domain-containing protein [Gammaproteobacteria bacterium]|nr:DUF2857 domain-containing protein [Gammaproteobacteria bacterium]
MSTATGTKESELVRAVLLYAIRCLAEGDQHALRDMNFGPDEVAALRDVNLADLYRIGALQAHCLDIRLNREIYWPLLGHLRRERELEDLQRDFIQADAPLEMMRRLFGVGSREYTRLRRVLTAEPATGRPPEPDEATSHALWHAWCQRTAPDPTQPLAPEAYLELSRETGASLRAVWVLTQRWAEYGDLSPAGTAPVTMEDADANRSPAGR